MAAHDSQSGFSTVELVLAMFLTLVVIGAAIGVMNPQAVAARLQPDVVDAQQRLRVSEDVLRRELDAAGAGSDSGPASGPLGGYLPPVIPRRIALGSSDPPTVALPDVVTILHVPSSSSQTLLASPLTTTTASLGSVPGCPLGKPACGFSVGAGLLMLDDEGHFDVFTVLGVIGPDVLLRHRGQLGPHTYQPGATVVQAEMRTYYFDAVTRQLRFSDGDMTDQPVVDGISAMSVQYFGSPAPPRLPKPPLGVANCLYDAAGVPDPGLASLSAGPEGLAALPLAMFQDGPWCGTGVTQFDADLLRIRRVRVTIEAAAASAPPGGRHPAITFDVAPRNLADQP